MFGVPVAYTPWFRHAGTRRQAPVRLPHADLRQLVRAGAPGRRCPTTTSSTRARTSPSRRSSPRTAAPCWAASTGVCTATATPSWPVPSPMPPGTRATTTARKGKDFRGYFRGFGGYGVSDHSSAGYDVYPARATIPSSTATRSTMRTCCAAASISRAQEDRNFWSLNGYYFQGLGPSTTRTRSRWPCRSRETRLVSDRMALGLLLHRRFQRAGADAHQGPGHAAALEPRRLDPALMSGRSATSTRLDVSLRGDVYNTEGDPEHLRAPTAATTREARVLPRFTADWSWPLADLTGNWVHEVEPMVSLNVAPTWGNTRNIPNEDSSDFEFDETNLFEPDPLSRPRSGRYRHPGRLRAALQLAGPARDRVQRQLRPELLVHRRIRSSRRSPASRTIFPTMSARSTCGPARCSTSATASGSARTT